jgi:hypothetical protein
LQVAYQSTQSAEADFSAGGMESLGAPEKAEELDIRIDSIKVVGLAFSAGVVAWALRVGGMMASLLATVPAWRNFDPMPIMAKEREKDEAWHDQGTSRGKADNDPNMETISREGEGPHP